MLINRLRRRLGIRGFAHFLMRLEGKLMNAVNMKFIEMKIPAIRLHDAMLVGESHVELVAAEIRATGRRLFHLEPKVST